MPNGTVTITAPTGPGVLASAQVITNVRQLAFNFDEPTAQITYEDGRVQSFDLSATATITATAASGVFTVTINQA